MHTKARLQSPHRPAPPCRHPRSGSFADIVDADKPAVVTIVTTMKAADTGEDTDNSEMQEQFRHFFEQQGIPTPRQAPQRQSGEHAQALGSGFIVSKEGYIVTNNHVIANATDIKVTLDDGTELPGSWSAQTAKPIWRSSKIEASKALPTISWGDSSKLKLGDQILAIGNPFGIGTTVTAGIVSARGRDLHSGPYDDFIQIDAPINPWQFGRPARRPGRQCRRDQHRHLFSQWRQRRRRLRHPFR
jgi:serine protease Do